jgi:site-specific DNA recombinase
VTTTRALVTAKNSPLRLVDDVIRGAIAGGSNACAIYNRYSTDLQDPRSLVDQETQNREQARRKQVSVYGVYNDAEKTSRTLHGRTGYARMMEDMRAGKFRTIIVESMDRLTREGGSVYTIFQTLQHYGVEIIESGNGGRVITLTDIAVYALVGTFFMKTLTEKVRRGMTGRVKDGLCMWKPAYGYRFKPGEKKLEIVPEQAEIIRRVFGEYIAGMSTRTIAERLRLEGVPSPSGRPWTHEAIMGGMSKALGGRRSGIIGNRTYLGQLHWGVGRYSMNPATGNRCAKPPTEEPIVIDVPELRIVSDQLWQAAHGRADARAVKNNIVGLKDRNTRQSASRNSRPLTDLVHCGTCGGHMILAFGRGDGRYRCSTAHKGLDCSHSKSYDTKAVQNAVREYLCDKFQDPEVIKTQMKAFTDGWNEHASNARKKLGNTQKRLADIEAELTRVQTGYVKGILAEEDVKKIAQPLMIERAHLRERETSAQSDIKPIGLHPKAFEYCQTFVGQLPTDLDDMSVEVRMAFRNMVGRVVVKETAPRAPYDIEVELFSEALTGGFNLTPHAGCHTKLLLEQGLAKSDSVGGGSPQQTLSYQPRRLVSLGQWRLQRAA